MASVVAPVSPSALPRSSSTVWGANEMRSALDRFRTLISLALAVAVLLLAERILTTTGIVTLAVPPYPPPIPELWTLALGLGLAVANGVAIAVLVILGILVALRGLMAWRRGVKELDRGADEFGPPEYAPAAHQARAEHSVTLWLFVAYAGAAIAVSIALAFVDFTLDAAGQTSLPDFVASVVTGLATGGVLVAIYYYGGRHIVGLLYGIASEAERRRLVRGRDLLLAGAVVGLGASFSSISWAFDILSVMSLALVLAGAVDLRSAYSAWVAGDRPPGAVSHATVPLATSVAHGSSRETEALVG